MILFLSALILGIAAKKPLSHVYSIFTHDLGTSLSSDGSSVSLKAPKPVKVQHYSDELWFHDQRVDHFNPVNTKKWSQRYYYNDTYYKAGGPVFLMIGGEGPATPKNVGDYYSIDYFAKSMSGLKVALEHRFYGASFPSTDSSDLSLLRSDQALADIATFLAYLKREYNLPKNTKVVAIGGSYSGNLAAWARIQFPFVIDAAISSSGPYLAQTDYPEYLQHIDAQIRKYGGDRCMDIISAAHTDAEYLLNHDKATLATIFKLKEESIYNSTAYDKARFMSAMGAPSGVVQYAKHDGYYTDTNDGDIKRMCKSIEAYYDAYDSGESYQQLKAYVSWLLGYYGGSMGEIDLSFDGYIKALQDTSIDSEFAVDRSWMWQTCVEFGYYQTSSSTAGFGTMITLDYFLEMCYKAFFAPGVAPAGASSFTRSQSDDMVNKAVQFTNVYYGARNIKMSNIYITNGHVDPWSELSYREGETWSTGHYLHNGSTASYIPNGSHCTDLYTSWSINDNLRATQLEFLKSALGY